MDKLTEILGKLFNIEKAPTQLIAVIFVASTAIIFLPEELLIKLKLLKFQSEYDIYIGPVCALTGLFLFFALIKFIYDKISNAIYRRRIISGINANLQKLTLHEKIFIREFVIQGKHTIYAPAFNETVISLENKRIIFKASNSGLETIAGVVWTFTLDEYAFKNLTLPMIGMSDNPTNAEKNKIYNERPDWTYSIEKLNI